MDHVCGSSLISNDSRLARTRALCEIIGATRGVPSSATPPTNGLSAAPLASMMRSKYSSLECANGKRTVALLKAGVPIIYSPDAGFTGLNPRVLCNP